MSQKSSSEIAVIGIDIGKNSFHVVGQDRRGARVHKISQITMLTARYNRIGRGRRVGRGKLDLQGSQTFSDWPACACTRSITREKPDVVTGSICYRSPP